MSRIVGRELRGYGGALTAGICGDMVYSLLHALKRAYQYGIRIERVIRNNWQERGKRRHTPGFHPMQRTRKREGKGWGGRSLETSSGKKWLGKNADPVERQFWCTHRPERKCSVRASIWCLGRVIRG